MKCAPGVHRYAPYGKVLYCQKCADVQPLLLSDEYEEMSPTHGTGRAAPPPLTDGQGAAAPSREEPATVEELEHAANLLREAVGLRSPFQAQTGVPEQLDLGVRHAMDDDELVNLSNQYTNPRVPAGDGFEGGTDEELPSPGL